MIFLSNLFRQILFSSAKVNAPPMTRIGVKKYRLNLVPLFALSLVILLQSTPAQAEIPDVCFGLYVATGAKPVGPNADWRELRACESRAATARGGLGATFCTASSGVEYITEYCGTACTAGSAVEDCFCSHTCSAGLSGQCVSPLESSICSGPPPPPIEEKEKGAGCDGEGNPCNPLTGNKFQVERDYLSANSYLDVTRYYNSLSVKDDGYGFGWTTSFSRRLVFSASNLDQVLIQQADGRSEMWRKVNGGWQGDPDSQLQLEENTAGLTIRNPNVTLEQYNSLGKLVSIADQHGLLTQYSYGQDGKLTQITGPFGRQLVLLYDANNRLHRIDTPDGPLLYTYDAQGNLSTVVYPDASTKTYHYENADFAHHLTGINDENNTRFASWSYDAEGRVTSSEHAGGVEKVTLEYRADGNSTRVLGALGDERTYELVNQHGVRKVAAVTGDPCMTCANGHKQSRTYDENGFLNSFTDWNGHRTELTNNARGLVESRTEAAGTPEERTTTTHWHPIFNLPVTVDEPGRQTRFTYSATGQLLTRTTEDTVTNAVRSTHYSYHPAGSNGAGLIASVDGPRTDVNDVVTYGYDSQGNLNTITNALGHTTQITAHDPSGRPLTLIDPNGTQVNMRYDSRGRLIRHSVADSVTSYDYDKTGQLIRITRGDDQVLDYQYDAAHRLIGIIDGAGNRIDYVLDAMGNRIKTDISDPAGTLTQTQSAVFDKLSRLQQQLGAQGQQLLFGYDANHNLLDRTDALERKTQNHYDALDQLIRSIDPDQNPTGYQYDNRGNLTQVTDAKGLKTTYTYNAFDELVEQTSPDTGTTLYHYDQAGNRVRQTDARGVSVEYAYDALNRLTLIDYADDAQDVTYRYDEGQHGVGRLTHIRDASGETAYAYDARGNLITQTHTVQENTYPISYRYNSIDLITSMTYPNGDVVRYQYNPLGQVTRLNATINGVEQTLLSNAEYLPFGPPKRFTYGNDLDYRASFDLSLRLNQQTISEWQDHRYDYNRVDNLLNLNDPLNTNEDQQFDYDALDRLKHAQGSYGTEEYHFDGVGNRLQKIAALATEEYAYGDSSHRLQSIRGASTLTFQYDAAGNTLDNSRYQFSYADDNRLREVKQANQVIARYRYNALGQRSQKDILNNLSGPDYAQLIIDAQQQLATTQAQLVEQQQLIANTERDLFATRQAEQSVQQQITELEDVLVTQHAELVPLTEKRQEQATRLARLERYQAAAEDRLYPNPQNGWQRWVNRLLNRWIAQLQKLIDQQNKALSETDQQITTHNQAIALTREKLSTAIEQRDDAQQQIQTLEQQLQAQQTVLSTLNQRISEIEAKIAEYQAHIDAGETTQSPLTTHYLYDQSGKLVAEITQGISKHYLYFNDQPFAMVENQQVYYYHNDHLGTPQRLTDGDKRIVWHARYAPFGTAEVTTESVRNNLRFPGQYFDEETGLHYNYHRYYDPSTGRYLTSDPIGLAGGLNTYAYVGSNPLRWIDPLGLVKSDPNTTFKKCSSGEWNICKSRCGNKGVLVCQAQITKKVRRIIDRNGQLIQRIHFDKSVNCECGDDDPTSATSCGDNCKKVLQTTRDVVTGAIILIWAVICSPFAS